MSKRIVSNSDVTRFKDLVVCVGGWGPIFQVRLNFSTDDRGTKDDRGEQEGGEGAGIEKSGEKKQKENKK